MGAAVATALCVPMQSALALTLGRITVQSALGQPLQAEVELPDITAEEALTLSTSIANAEAFRAAGLEYNAALADVRITPQRRADGRMVLRVSSDRPVNDPFIDLILQATWASGRTVRDYTLLLDPPSQQQARAGATTAPQLPPAAAPAPPAPAAQAGPATQPPAAAPSAAPRAPAAATTPAPGEALTVRRGDTAGRIAAANKSASVSLDQMLVAMLRSNPDAFIQSNVNRLKAGAVLDMPSADQAASLPAPEASRIIAAQARDFNAFRSRLAEQVPSVQTGAERTASGRVQAQVDENRPAAAAADKLTLSKGGVQARAKEEQIARDKAATESAERVAELSRNIQDLNKLGVTAPPAPASAPAPAATASAPAEAAAPAAPPAPAPPAVEPPPAPTVPKSPPLPPPPVPQDSAGPFDELLQNPLVPAAAVLLLLLAGLVVYRMRQRKKAAGAEEEDRLPVESFIVGSGGQHVDTADAGEATASMVYSPSQLDATGEVDPVAEADVYLAYGRDLQAEEILKEALRTAPERVAIHAKLAEIYAKRRDATAFQAVAEKAHALTGGKGSEWDHIAELGRALAPANPLWNKGAAAGIAGAAVASAAAVAAVAPAPRPPVEPVAPPADESLWPDSMLTPQQEMPVEPPPAAAAAPVAAPPPDTLSAVDFDLDMDFGDAPAKAPTPAAAQADGPPKAADIDFDFDVQSTYTPPLQAPAPPAATNDSALLPFDLGSLSLDLGEPSADRAPAAAANAAPEPESNDPLATKLSLAEEFHVIGDTEGARALAEEVLAEASGPLKAQAQRFLAELG